MPDVFHWFGSDVSLDSTGDLVLTQSAAEEAQTAIVRRLMTAAGGYLWHLEYGAGLPERIGNPVTGMSLEGIVMGQMLKEASVARQPAPKVIVSPLAQGAYVQIQYNDVVSGRPVALSLTVPAERPVGA